MTSIIFRLSHLVPEIRVILTDNDIIVIVNLGCRLIKSVFLSDFFFTKIRVETF
jgi:hypothetical protein